MSQGLRQTISWKCHKFLGEEFLRFIQSEGETKLQSEGKHYL